MTDDPVRLLQQRFREAAEAGDPEAIETVLAEAAQLAHRDTRKFALAAMRDVLASTDDADIVHLAMAWAKLRPAEREAGLLPAASPLPRPEFLAADRIPPDRPQTILAATDTPGAVLTAGEVVLLGGDGGVGKSALVREIALAVGARRDVPPMPGRDRTAGGILAARCRGPVLWASWEEHPAIFADLLRGTASARDAAGEMDDDPGSITMARMSGWPLFGTPDTAIGRAPARRMDGWQILEAAADELQPRLIVIDPFIPAFTGDWLSWIDVRQFLSALGELAGRYGGGALVITHGTKGAARSGDPLDEGHFAGARALVQSCRGALVLYRRDDEQGGEKVSQRYLAVPKANLGVDRIEMPVAPRRSGGPPAGFVAAGRWGPIGHAAPHDAAPAPPGNGAARRSGGDWLEEIL